MTCADCSKKTGSANASSAVLTMLGALKERLRALAALALGSQSQVADVDVHKVIGAAEALEEQVHNLLKELGHDVEPKVEQPQQAPHNYGAQVLPKGQTYFPAAARVRKS